MNLKGILLFVVTATFFAPSSGTAGRPEFDAVGCDAINVFARNNLAQHLRVILNNPGNYYSDWSETLCEPAPCTGREECCGDVVIAPLENFKPSGTTQAHLDPCFYDSGDPWDIFSGFMSHAALTGHSASFEWVIVLQMMPESDIDVNIYDCVLKPNCQPFEYLWEKRIGVRQGVHRVKAPQSLWECANETGFFRIGQNSLFFAPGALPEITVQAITQDGDEFALDARAPRVRPRDVLSNKSFISKAIWDEGIIAELPEVGILNSNGQTEDMLIGGDRIRVTVTVPPSHPNEIRYGRDSVILEYIGTAGMSSGTQCFFPDEMTGQ